jgi:UDP-glucose-4-epimerase GalE
MRRSVIVSGGAGYVGSHACKALAAAGFIPVTLDNLSVGRPDAVRWGPLEIGDILDAGRVREVVAAHRPAAVLHFAALASVGESVEDPALYWQTNVTGTTNLLDACRASGVGPFILSSTCAVYGVPEVMPIRETTPEDPVNPYGATKLAAEWASAHYCEAYGLTAARLRYFNAAGADPDGEIGETRDRETHLIPLALDAVLGRRPALKIMGADYPTEDGTAVRDYVHVSDLADAHVAALRNLLDGGQSFTANLGTGVGHSVQSVVETVERVTGRAVPREVVGRRPGDPPTLVADPSFARRLLGIDFGLSVSLDDIVETAWRCRSSHERGRSAASVPAARSATETRCSP